jgi:hypothetical protein
MRSSGKFELTVAEFAQPVVAEPASAASASELKFKIRDSRNEVFIAGETTGFYGSTTGSKPLKSNHASFGEVRNSLQFCAEFYAEKPRIVWATSAIAQNLERHIDCVHHAHTYDVQIKSLRTAPN